MSEYILDLQKETSEEENEMVSCFSVSSFDEDCGSDRDSWLHYLFYSIDKIVFLDRSPPANFPNYLTRECQIWRNKFVKKFTKSELGSMFIKYNHEVDLNIEHNGSAFYSVPKHLVSSKLSHSVKDLKDSSSSSLKSSSLDLSLIDLRFEDKSKFVSKPSTDYELKSSAKKNTINSSHACKPNKLPIVLPPIQKRSNVEQDSKLVSNNIPHINRKKNKALNSAQKGFPLPPKFVSINQLMSTMDDITT